MTKKIILQALFCFIMTQSFCQSWTNYNDTNSGLSNNLVSSISIDKNDNVWISASNGCSDQHGLNKFDGTNWIHYDQTNSGLVSDAVCRVITDQNNNIWITYFCGGMGLTKFDGINWTTYNTSNSNLPSNWVADLFVDSNNALWLASNGITKFNGTSFINYFPNPDSLYPVTALYVADSIVYATGGNLGLYKFNIPNSAITQYTTVNSNIPSMHFGTLALDQNGILWMGSQDGFQGSMGGGIATFDGNTFTALNPFASNYTWVYYNQSIAVDQSNNIWVSTRSEGLYKYNGSNWIHIGANLPQNGTAGFVYVDHFNKIWYGDTYSGVWTNNLTLSTSDQSTVEKINIYPNPVIGLLTFDLKPNKPQKFDVQIYNTSGQLILRKEFNVNKTITTGPNTINVADLSNGIYFIKIITDEKTISQKFVKQ